MTNKHTPGPWSYEGEFVPEKGFRRSRVAASTLIAEVYSTAFGDIENEKANAELIAAAPEMKDALIGIHELWGGDDGYLKEVEACEELGNESPVLKAWKQLLSAIKKSGGM